jgi:excisionase family DNA binding protein
MSTGGIAMNDRQVLTVSEAANVLRLSRAFTYELVARGEIPAVRLGRRIMIPGVAIDRLLENSMATFPNSS